MYIRNTSLLNSWGWGSEGSYSLVALLLPLVANAFAVARQLDALGHHLHGASPRDHGCNINSIIEYNII